MRRAVRQRLTVLGLTAPAYVWLALTIFLPLSAMFYFSFLTVVPWGTREASVTLGQYAAFFEKSVYRINAWRSLKMGLHVTLGCLVVGRYNLFRGMPPEVSADLVSVNSQARSRQWLYWNAKKLAKKVAGRPYLAARQWLLRER